MIELKSRGLLLTLSLLALLGGCNANLDPQQVKENTVSSSNQPEVMLKGVFEVDQPAPQFSTQTSTGEIFESNTLYGQQAIVLGFWSGWCPYCVTEIPELQKIQDSYPNQIAVIGVHRSDTEDLQSGMEAFTTLGGSYLVIQDNGELYRATGGIGMPVAVFIDKQGIVKKIKIGSKNAAQIAEDIQLIAD